MDVPNIFSSETSEHEVCSPTPVVSNMANPLPPPSRTRKNRSESWDHFTVESEVEKKAKCIYCGTLIKFNNGTSTMRAHWLRCQNISKEDGSKRQKSGSCSTADMEGNSSAISKFDQLELRKSLGKVFIGLELPFRKVGHEALHNFLNLGMPQFKIPSRTTLSRDILQLWGSEKVRLKTFLSHHCGRVCLTTDFWTSSQNYSYMSLTAHFVDNNWKLNKKILNFCQVAGHSGDVMAQTVWNCLCSWGLNQVLNMTVDNASSNDVGISQLKKVLMPNGISQLKKVLMPNGLLLGGMYFHTRCCAHVLNLIVKEGLKDIEAAVLRIRGAVRYIQASPSRLQRFKSCIDSQKVEYKGFVNLDVETRWNSTYLMLDAAFKHMPTFAMLEMQDSTYVKELRKGKGLPLPEDWKYVQSILPFLELFYNATMRMSGSSYVTSNMYMFEVFGIGKKIKEMCNHPDTRIAKVAKDMKIKYDKYWGDPNSLNMLLVIALILDPRHKMKFIVWYADKHFGKDEAKCFQEKVYSSLNSLFNEYNGQMGESSASSQEYRSHDSSKSDPYGFNPFYKSTGSSKSGSEVNAYLAAALEKEGELDVLMWWRENSNRYPVLARIAREVLAIPVSTVASESAFSTGGRVLDPYRSSLSSTTVEALVCTQDWLKVKDEDIDTSSFVTNDDLDTLQGFEQEVLTQLNCGGYSGSVRLDDD